MSSNNNHITLANYEEWFVLYMDNELRAEEKAMVDHFLLLHPHLQEEMDLLQSTKLPVDDIVFTGKADLQADAMKLNAVDENLLLYIDNELSAGGKKEVEQKLATDSNFRLQHDVLSLTKFDASEIIPYPNKEELYRRTGSVVFFPSWMRIAVAVVLVLFASLLFVFRQDKNATDVASNGAVTKPSEQKNVPLPTSPSSVPVLQQEQAVIAQVNKQPTKPASNKTVQKNEAVEETILPSPIATTAKEETASLTTTDNINIDVKKINTALNNLVANPSVTSATPVALNITEDPEGPAVSDGDYKPKRSSAKGFLRKVSRFIEKRTGIGTANVDDEVLVGAVALKLN